MTAVIGILNRHAIAIAADSAVTIGGPNNRKIFNRANKIFSLSKFHPVGAMLYNSASFLGTPWETIIKLYRRQLNNHSFDTLNEYVNDFIEFIHEHDFFSDAQTKSIYIKHFIFEITALVFNEAVENSRHLIGNPAPLAKQQIIDLVNGKCDEFLAKLQANNEYCFELQDLTAEVFEAICHDFQDETIHRLFQSIEIDIPDELLNKIKSLVFHFIKAKEDFTGFTGLIFVGYGDLEIYPQLIPIDISLVVDTRLRYFIDQGKEVHITNQNPGVIQPFAQRDVIDTILSGIAPKLEETFMENFQKLFSKYNTEILRILGQGNPEIIAQIQSLDLDILTQEYLDLNNQIKRSNFIAPLLNAVSNLSKEDLAEMAESMIYLTYLKRRITFAEESVGGPVDVALISKGDGFIWIKRKHYFRPELNQHFINNYLNT